MYVFEADRMRRGFLGRGLNPDHESWPLLRFCKNIGDSIFVLPIYSFFCEISFMASKIEFEDRYT
jgi:hypothetical protein